MGRVGALLSENESYRGKASETDRQTNRDKRIHKDSWRQRGSGGVNFFVTVKEQISG